MVKKIEYVERHVGPWIEIGHQLIEATERDMYAIELPDGTLYPRRRWRTAEAAGRFLATAADIKCGAVVSVPRNQT
jgi:hypothetical protein